ncbi:MAG: GDP-mannose 4,6-dehydratase [Solirubrobacteraceae bacterium]|nr:GDP-mannose 4,6-dehydratase [Solirubrobacteraceae bacterium]
MARTLVTGISGQDGSYLGELLLERGDEVIGMVREAPEDARERLIPELREVELVHGDLAGPESLRQVIATVKPERIYHLAAPTFVPASWTDPAGSLHDVAGATFTLLNAVEQEVPQARVFLASSAEVFGDCGESPQHERTPTFPRSPYGIGKLAALRAAHVWRSRGLHVSAGILFNHESPRRPERFLPRKVTKGAARVATGLLDELEVGDRRAIRDWSHARDLMAGAILAVEHDVPDDYVFASGHGHSVGELIDLAFRLCGLEAEEHVRVNPAFVRDPEATAPVGDPSKAQRVLGWLPEFTFDQVIAEMVEHDLALARGEADAPNAPPAG